MRKSLRQGMQAAGLALFAMTVSACVSVDPAQIELTSASPEPALSPASEALPVLDAATGAPVLGENGAALVAAVPHKAPRTSPTGADIPAPTPAPVSPAVPADVFADISPATPEEPVTQIASLSESHAQPSASEPVTAPDIEDIETLQLVPAETASIEPPADTSDNFLQPLFPKRTGTSKRQAAPRRDSKLIEAGIVPIGARASTRIKAPPTPSAVNPAVNNQDLAALPGVKSNAKLFATSDNEPEEAEGAFELASAGALGRLSPKGLLVQHDKVEIGCLKPEIIRVVNAVERRFGKKPVITSGYRSPKRNQRAGGVRNSAHISCNAVDLQVKGVAKRDLAAYLRSMPGRGGVGTYCRTKSVHVDTGSKRDWYTPCRKSSLKKAAKI